MSNEVVFEGKCKSCDEIKPCIQCESCGLLICEDCLYEDENGDFLCLYCIGEKVICKECGKYFDKRDMVTCIDCGDNICISCAVQDDYSNNYLCDWCYQNQYSLRLL